MNEHVHYWDGHVFVSDQRIQFGQSRAPTAAVKRTVPTSSAVTWESTGQ